MLIRSVLVDVYLDVERVLIRPVLVSIYLAAVRVLIRPACRMPR